MAEKLSLSIKIGADTKQALDGFVKLKDSVAETIAALKPASSALSRLQDDFARAGQRTDSLGIQLALTKKALSDLAAQGISKTHADFQALTGEIQVMEAELKRAVAETAALEKAEKAAAGEVEKIEKRLSRQAAELARSAAALKKSGVDVENLGNAYKKLEADARAADRAMRTQQGWAALSAQGGAAAGKIAKRKADEAQLAKLSGAASAAAAPAVDVQTAKADAGIDRLTKKIGVMGHASAKLFALWQSAKGAGVFLDRLGEVQHLEARIRGLTGDTNTYAASLKFLDQLSISHHKSVNSLADGYARLLVLQNSGVITNRQSQAILAGLSNAQSALGATAAQLDQVMFGLAQALSSPIVGAEELKQVVEPLPGLLQALDRAAQLPAGGFRRMVNEGRVTSEMFAGALVTALGEIEGAAARMGNTVPAKYADVQNAWLKLVKSLEAPVSVVVSKSLDFVSEGVKGIGTAIDDLVSSPGMHAFLALKNKFLGFSDAKELQAFENDIKRVQDKVFTRGAGQQNSGPTFKLQANGLAELGQEVAKAKTELERLSAAQKQGAVTADQVKAATDRYKSTLALAAAALGQERTGAADRVQQLEREAQSKQRIIQIQSDMARAAGAEEQALRLAGAAREQDVITAAAVAEEKRKEADATRLYADVLAEQARVLGDTDGKTKAAIAAAQNDAAAKRAAAEEARVYATSLQQLPAALDAVTTAHATGRAELAKYKEEASAAIAIARQTDDAYRAGKASAGQLAQAHAAAAGAVETYNLALQANRTHVEALAEDAQRGTALIEQEYQVRIQSLQALRASAQARGDEAGAARLGLDIAREEVTQAFALTRARESEAEATRAKLRAIEEEARADGVLTVAEQEVIKSARDAAKSKELEAGAALGAAKAKLAEAESSRKSAADKAQAARQSAADIGATGTDRVREIKRRDMAPEDQQADITKQANEKLAASYDALAKARSAASSGKTDQAEKLAADAQKAADAAASLGESLQSTDDATGIVQKATEAAQAAQNTVAQANDEVASRAKANVDQLGASIAALGQTLQAVSGEPKSITVQAQTDKAVSGLDEVKARLDGLQDKTITVTVTQENGAAPTITAKPAPAAPGFAQGTILPGYGGGDRRLAYLEDGEAVLPKERVRRLGYDNVRRLIAGQFPGFAAGGIVGRAGALLPTATPSGAGFSGRPVNLHLPNGQSFPLAGAPDVADALSRAIGKEALKHGRAK